MKAVRRTQQVTLLLIALGMMNLVFAQQQSDDPPKQEGVPPSGVGEAPIPVDDGFLLNEKEISDLSAKANKGDARAALSLSLHYMAVKKPIQKSYWDLLASALGMSSAQYGRWFESKDAPDCKTKIEALAWLKAASLSGDELPVEKLKEYEPTVQSCFEH